MDSILLLTVIIMIALFAIVTPIVIAIMKWEDKKCLSKSKFNNIRVGMSESELYSEFGAPQQVIEADDATKVVTYRKNEYALLFLVCVGIEAQVSIKNGAVTNTVVSVKK